MVVGILIDSDHSNTGIVFNGASSNSTVENNVVRVSAGNKTINVGGQYTGRVIRPKTMPMAHAC